LSITFLSSRDVNLKDFRDFVVRTVWQRDWGEEVAANYFSWRYCARESGDTLLAYDGNKCVGVLDSFLRPYWMNGRRVLMRETCDWFCLPAYRPFGVGLHLMRRMMAEPEPIIVVGGTDDTQSLLPRLKWGRLPDVNNFILVVSTRTLAGMFARRRFPAVGELTRFVPDITLVRRIPHFAPPTKNSEVRVRVPGDGAEDLDVLPYALAPAIDGKTLDWFANAPEALGQFLLLSFFCEGRLVGLSISRLQMQPSLGCVSRIVHIRSSTFEAIDWIVGATVQELMKRGSGAIKCTASCPRTGSALAAIGFQNRPPSPAHIYPGDIRVNGLMNLSSLQADDALGFH
jgi:hypothetical protein